MDRKKEQIERYRFDFTRGEDTTRGLPHAAQRVKKTKKKPAPGPIVSDHTPDEYTANVETVREGMRLGDYYEVVLRQTFRAPYTGGAVGTVRADSESQPQPVRIFPPVRRRTIDRRVARDVRARGTRTAAAWRPAPSPAPRDAPAIRCATPTTSASC